jgi:feruloyl esterase
MRFLLALVTGSVAAWGAGTPCNKLTALTIATVTVRAASMVTAPETNVPAGLPPFCRVEAVVNAVPDSEVRFELWMPAPPHWNGKFQGTGNGGYSGALNFRAMAEALRRGYATASHNTGHDGDTMKFGQGHPEKVIDFGHRATHLMTEYAKLLVRVHLGKHADYSYFVGCSSGGHQAIAEAQRYPDDYDGIVAGAPANNRIGQTFAFVWSWLALHRDDGSLIVPEEKLKLITKAVVESCDARDGLRDGLIEDPRRCDPAAIAPLLNADEAAAIRKVWAGLKSPRTGQPIFAGWPMGSEDFGDGSWRTYLTAPREPSRVDFFRFFLFHDPHWDFRTLDWDRDFAYAQEKLGFFSSNAPNLGAFRQRGGKLLLYAGWADPVVSPLENVAYYDSVVKAMGGLPATQQFARLFLAPGMGHCGGGPGPNQFDFVGALDAWVTKGNAPAVMIAKNARSGRTRPLCVYPQVAKYKGTGSIDEAANFVCR